MKYVKLPSPEPRLHAALNSTARALLAAQYRKQLERIRDGLVTAPADADFRVAQGQAQALQAVINQLETW